MMWRGYCWRLIFLEKLKANKKKTKKHEYDFMENVVQSFSASLSECVNILQKTLHTFRSR